MVHNTGPLIGGMLYVQYSEEGTERGRAPTESSSVYQMYNSPPMKAEYTKLMLFDMALTTEREYVILRYAF